MAVNEETKTALHEMGLNAYEIDTYLALLEGGQIGRAHV
jgi:sugar-specific transcriptional regulator TrmB